MNIIAKTKIIIGWKLTYLIRPGQLTRKKADIDGLEAITHHPTLSAHTTLFLQDETIMSFYVVEHI